MPNFNDAAEQREVGAVIPDGTFVKLKLTMKGGGYSKPGEDPRDNGLFKLNPATGTVSIEGEYSVIGGRFNGLHIYQWTTVDGGSMNDKGQSIAGNISKSFFRAVCESAYGVHPQDMTPQANAYRSPPAYSLLQGVEFFARLGIEAGGPKQDGSGNYPDKNIIAHVVVPGEPEYDMMKAGQEPEPKPSGVRNARAAGAVTGQPVTGQGNLWGQGAAPAPATHWTAQPPQPGAAAPAPAPAPYQPGQPQQYAQPNGPAPAPAPPPQQQQQPPAAAPNSEGGQFPAWMGHQG